MLLAVRYGEDPLQVLADWVWDHPEENKDSECPF
jgi:hypothetical protein